jgi:type VI secretion system secreted protein VgrG
MSSILPTQAYELKLAPQPAPFSVLRFKGHDALSELYRYRIDFTSPVAGIPMEQVLGRPAKFIIAPIDPNMDYLRKMLGDGAQAFSEAPDAVTIHGIITRFQEFGTSADETHYRVTLEPRLADLARGVTSRLFQHQSVPEIISDTLKHEGYREGVDFSIALKGNYPRREYVTQYHETTVAFIQRIAAEEGIWFRFEQRRDGEMIAFGDDLSGYARNQRTVPFRRDSGLESSGAESIKTLRRHMQRVPESVRLHEYNHRQAGVSLLVEQNAARDDTTTNAVDYHWGEHYLTPDEGTRIAQLRHEAHLAGQLTYNGSANPFSLAAGEVMLLDANPADAPHGLLVTSVRSRGGRGESFWLTFTGMPADRQWRPVVDPAKRPSIDGILPARITSPGNYQYAYLTEQGWYVIVLPFDLDEWSPGGTSRPVRFAKPYSGDTYGHHFPLIDGAEVALVFTNGDPDRPIILGAMHDSVHPDLVNNLNNTRNLIRTAAQNEMRMEDKRGIEHIHLTTPFQTSELNLGHMVDEGRKERGQGAELRSDGPTSVRGKGVLVSAEVQAGASGKQLDMAAAKAQLEDAWSLMKDLTASAQAARAHLAELDQQKQFLEQRLSGLQRAVILASAPDGIALTSGQHLQLAASNNLTVNAGGAADIGVLKKFTVVAGEAISMLARTCGMKLFSAKGKVEIQAQADEMEISALKDLKISSVDGKLILAATKEVWIGAGGSYIKVTPNGIENGTPGDILEKCASWDKPSAASEKIQMPELPQGVCRDCRMDAALSRSALTPRA